MQSEHQWTSWTLGTMKSHKLCDVSPNSIIGSPSARISTSIDERAVSPSICRRGRLKKRG